MHYVVLLMKVSVRYYVMRLELHDGRLDVLPEHLRQS